VPDTVGYAMPEQFGALIAKINARIKDINPNVILSVHCHNDLGLATANTLAAIKNGADKVECTVNGIGERAGNCAFEEVAMALKTRADYFGADSRVNIREIKNTSALVSALMGIDVQVNKAIVGDNAFAHSSGIHQDGLLKSKDVYEIIDPRDIGLPDMELILTARSGKAALKAALARLGVQIATDQELTGLQAEFLEMADAKKEVYDIDLYKLMQRHLDHPVIDLYELNDFQVVTNTLYPVATVKVQYKGEMVVKTANGNGPIDAMFQAIQLACGRTVELLEYKINSLSSGEDATGRATVKVSHGGAVYSARAVARDIIAASGDAFINAINKILISERGADR